MLRVRKMTPIESAEFYLKSFGHCHHDPLASKKIIEDLLKELKELADERTAQRAAQKDKGKSDEGYAAIFNS
jgi:hypothetical protein